MNFSVNGQLRRAVYAAFASSLAGLSVSAFAQESGAASAPIPPAQEAAGPTETLLVQSLPAASEEPATQEKAVKLQKVEVTGSRIRRSELESSSPVFVLDRRAIEQTGASTIGDLLQEMPTIAGAATNPQVNNGGGDGGSTVSLRGLGSARTLLLLNGRRLITTDVNAIPVNLVERVEVLKDGASAIYGSDAIGGVVNFITRKKFEGGDLSYTYGISEREDADKNNASLSFGAIGERGDIQIGLNYNAQESVSAFDRSFSKFPYGLRQGQTTLGEGATSAVLTGRYVVPRSVVFDPADPDTASFNCGAESGQNVDATNVILTRRDATDGSDPSEFRCFRVGVEAYNFQPFNLLVTPQERLGGFLTGSRQITDTVSVYTEALYHNTESKFIIAPLPFIGDQAGVGISADNIYNPFDVDINSVRLRTEALGPRSGQFRTDRMQLTSGLKGSVLNDRFAWDVFYTYGTEEQVNTNFGDIFLPPLRDALGPSFIAADGTPTCGTAASPIPGCVPVNFFNQPAADQVAYLRQVAQPNVDNISRSDLAVFGANINGDIMELPAGNLGLALGYEFRKESLKFTPDFLPSTGEITGGGLSAISGGFDVNEIYAEASIPVLAGLPFVKALSVSVGTRFSDFSTFGQTTKSKIGLEYRPYGDLLVRGTYATVFRAPTISNLFGGQSESADTIDDPCVGFTSADTDPNHQLACNGVAANGTYSQTGYQTNALVGGNPDVEPESGNTTTFGFVYNPSWYAPISITVDHWDFKLKDTITTVGSSTRVNQCYDNGLFCDSFTRDAEADGGDGAVNSVIDVIDNVGKTRTSGVDAGLRFDFGKTAYGRFGYNVDLTYIYRYTNERLAGDPTSQVRNVGTFVDQSSGGDGHFARYRASSNLRWKLADFSAALNSRYIHSVTEDPGDAGDSELPGFVAKRKVEAVIYHDVQLTYTLKPIKTDFTIGVDNLTDEAAPLIYSGFNGTTDVRTYDVIGRAYYGRVKLNF